MSKGAAVAGNVGAAGLCCTAEDAAVADATGVIHDVVAVVAASVFVVAARRDVLNVAFEFFSTLIKYAVAVAEVALVAEVVHDEVVGVGIVRVAVVGSLTREGKKAVVAVVTSVAGFLRLLRLPYRGYVVLIYLRKILLLFDNEGLVSGFDCVERRGGE